MLAIVQCELMYMFWGKIVTYYKQPWMCIRVHVYNTRFVYCRELAPGTISLTGGWVRDDDSKQYGYNTLSI